MKFALGIHFRAMLSFILMMEAAFKTSANATALADTNTTTTDFDVIVIGGGYSGLAAAYDLQQAGLKTALLEARSEVGGKTRSQKLQSGPGIIELGATWINNKTQPAVFALTQHFGLKTLEQYTKGDSIFQSEDGEISRDSPGGLSDVTNLTTVQEAEIKLLTLLSKAVEKVDIRNSSNFPEKEDLSVSDWIALQGLWDYPHVPALASALTSSIVGREPDEIGAHYFFDYIKSGFGFESLLSEGQDGAQSLMIEEGTQSLAKSLANALPPGTLFLNTPVTQIHQTPTSITLTTKSNQTLTAKKAILATTRHTHAAITFTPPLPCPQTLLIARTRPGIYAKIILTYASPWWRHAGLVGKFTSLLGPIRFSWEISNPALSQYSLAIFVAGDKATCWHALSKQDKEGSVIEHLATLVGSELAGKARDVLEVNYVEWTKEEYIFGAPVTTLGPGVLRKYGGILREPVGNVHFAGTELAVEWKGYLEGAVASGQRAAGEVVDSLRGGS